MAADMDIDMDIDLSTGPDIAELEDEAMRIDGSVPIIQDIGANGQTQDVAEPAAEKVHIRGLDNLTTGDIKAFAQEHFPSDQYQRVEWIDDTSANILYETSEAAFSALTALTDPEITDPTSISTLELRQAKRSSSHPESVLYIRQAVVTDVKKPRAHEASRFYLMNPDKDPRERRKQQGPRRDGGDEFNRRRFDDREHKRRQDQNGSYDVSMYDDDTAEPAPRPRQPRRRDSYSSSDAGSRRRSNVRGRGRPVGDLLDSRSASKSDGRLRNRSASPLRDGDGRYGFSEDTDAAARRVRRRKLFASKRTHPNKRSRELFPNRTSMSNHRRSDALDRDETADLFATTSPNSTKGRSLADRISGTGGATLLQEEGFSIRGSAQADVTNGFSIRGAGTGNTDVRELFPLKSGGSNSGKELFGEKIKGRGGPRRKAEDMYF
ncbi:hypothetical protein K490DRAFT_45214 [Saccharata proteae CBS 121410]|uniref:Uncharacterized protein n=1 Tax=Saccharata proteae CBS 121410 TaxID=1314787 RepID=A0A9P4HQM1_9PEZI|nr:hypothetical protein K490DRAFT_45214 [Saccharata proteae CBS 121410]